MMARFAVYDKAKWHYEGSFPKDLPRRQAYVHTGMFLTWMIDHDLYSEEFLEDNRAEIPLVKSRVITGTVVYQRGDGVLAEDMLNEEGNAFARFYYGAGPHAEPHYLKDYDAVLAPGLPGTYYVDDTWENYARIARRIDQRHREWIEAGRPGRPSGLHSP